ncbi:MAG: hypothetical protein ACXAEN_24795 [Candidatus Thorarchaeota archaeon]
MEVKTDVKYVALCRTESDTIMNMFLLCIGETQAPIRCPPHRWENVLTGFIYFFTGLGFASIDYRKINRKAVPIIRL